MIFFYYFFAAIQLLFAFKSFRGGIDYLKYFKQELSRPKSDFTPMASVIVPCRGVDNGFRENLEAIFDQDYPEFEVVFVVDSEEDPALSVISEISQEQKNRTKLIVAGKAFDSGQKVHNLRKAVAEISETSEALVYVDSDARPKKDWLRSLIAPLEDENTGCSTGYRWFIQKDGGFATQLRSVWNASIASALGSTENDNFCWGGSTAIRRKTFEELKINEKWKGTLSDDFALTNVLKQNDLPIYFVPQCLTPTVEDCSFNELLEFTTRQMKITRVYSPKHFVVSIVGSVLFTLAFWGGILYLFLLSGIHFWIVLGIILVLFALGAGKAILRLNAVKLVLPNHQRALKKQLLPQLIFWTISPLLFLYNNILSLLSRKIIWRGIEYKLESANKTIVGSDNG